MNTLIELNDKLKKTNITEFNILNFLHDKVMTIVGSFDFSYYHEVEIYIHNPSYISCPTSFAYATFRVATLDEKKI